MIQVDKDKALFLLCNNLDGLKSDKQKDGINYLLDRIMGDEQITDVRHAAYMLATAWHETAKTMQPIEEYGRGIGKKYGKPVDGKCYFGRGYVQLTWRDNYSLMGQAIKQPLAEKPELALDPDIAYEIMSRGMRKGSFTGVKLSTYIEGEKCDYLNARKIINGLDCAERIAEYAKTFEAALKESEVA